jgi:uncharacterized surface protein with fasciclin (FAS1) repeats
VARIIEIVSVTGELKTLSEALIVSGIDKVLSEAGPYTLFAPSEQAFSEIGADALVALAADCEDLAYTLRSHVVNGRLMLSDLFDLERLKSIEGAELWVSRGEDGEAYVEEARIVRGDIEADNGVIHVVDLVLLPPTDEVGIAEQAVDFASTRVAGIADEVDEGIVFGYETHVGIGEEDGSVAV